MGWPLPYSETKLTPAKQKTLLDDFDKKFRAAVDHPTWVNWRKNAIECFKYKEGDQWTTNELTELKARGQPPTVNNQISVTVERMVGQFVKQKTRIAYRGRNPQDEPLAQALSDTLLFVRQNNQLEFEERDMADDGFTGGFGALETYISFDDVFQPEVKIRRLDGGRGRFSSIQASNSASSTSRLFTSPSESMTRSNARKPRASSRSFIGVHINVASSLFSTRIRNATSRTTGIFAREKIPFA